MKIMSRILNREHRLPRHLDVKQIEELAAGAADVKSWAEAMKGLVRRETVPDFLLDVSLHRYLRKLVKEPPGLAAMYEARMF